MSAIDPDLVSCRSPVDARGDRTLTARLDGDVKVCELEASVIGWNTLSYERVVAYV